jgi:hypothetical protein
MRQHASVAQLTYARGVTLDDRAGAAGGARYRFLRRVAAVLPDLRADPVDLADFAFDFFFFTAGLRALAAVRDVVFLAVALRLDAFAAFLAAFFLVAFFAVFFAALADCFARFRARFFFSGTTTGGAAGSPDGTTTIFSFRSGITCASATFATASPVFPATVAAASLIVSAAACAVSDAALIGPRIKASIVSGRLDWLIGWLFQLH